MSDPKSLSNNGSPIDNYSVMMSDNEARPYFSVQIDFSTVSGD
ncbi:hypothetical protein BN136_1719 [Cronobacter universalis NCTC 9529]|nr:hypothetical protein BN136_1719 [Cronobacter universalis NCTC 9529]